MGGRPGGPPSAAGETARQLVKFTFLKIDPAWRLLAKDAREAAKREFCDAVDGFGNRMLIGSYSLIGIRGDADILLWQVGERLEDFQALATAIFSTGLGPYLQTPYAYLSMTRRSIYKTPDLTAEPEHRLRVSPGTAKYLFVYPFVKTRAWYALDKDARQEMMTEHITVGRKYPSVKLNTTYSYGIDDQEFVVSFETDNPTDFLDLVMELRDSKASAYTLRDTPAFTCIALPLPGTLDSIGAPGDAIGAGERSGNGSAATGSASRGEWTRVARLSEVQDGGAHVVYFSGEQVALFNVAGVVYAIDNRCTHANGPLSEGDVVEGCVTCPWHSSQFDIASGRPLQAPAQKPVRTYRVSLDGDAIFLATAEAEAAAT